MNGVDRDRVFDLLAALPAASPTAAAAERLRARCHAALGQQSHIQKDHRWPWLCVAASLLYLAAAVAQALTILLLT
jgi:hypothetical protein